MQRSKNTDSNRSPKPGGGFWLAGLMIGGTIMSMATGAAMMGASMAIRDAGLKGS